MEDFVPKDIVTLIERIEDKRGEEYQARKRAEEAEAERLRKIEALRQERKDELTVACLRIDLWIRRFNETIGPSIWRLRGAKSSVVLFIGKFWRGEPTPAGDVVCGAQLRLGGPGTGFRNGLVYEELHKGQVSFKQPLLGAIFIWEKTHPDFVMQCDAHLSGPDAWKYVRQDLEQMDRHLTLV